METIYNGRYEWRLEVKPSAEKRRLSQLMVEAVSRKLGLTVPPVRFFYRGYPPEEVYGYTDGETIWVAVDLDNMFTCETIIHEARHIWQFSDPVWRNRSERERERDAAYIRPHGHVERPKYRNEN